ATASPAGSESSSGTVSSAGASSSVGRGGQTSSGAGGGGGEMPIGGDRPVTVHVPPGSNPNTPMPLVMLLHGYSASGDLQESYMMFTPIADAKGFLYVHPDGTKDAMGLQFWNATNACCDFGSPKIDDSTYLETVIQEIEQRYN